MNTLAFIPARGGSQRLPGKNILPFAGRPLIYYSIAFARVHNISRIVVSTDNDEIARVASSFGAEILIRPEHLSTHVATTASAAQHCLDAVQQSGFSPDIFITLQPTNPLRPFTLFDDAMLKFQQNNWDSVISVGKNKHKLGVVEHNGFTPATYAPGTRSQDLKDLYFESGAIYLTDPKLISRGEIFGERIGTVLTDPVYSDFDIDTQFEFDLAQQVFGLYESEFTYLLKG